jgi:tetratricopeptide (TPR) repeat protein
MGAMAGRTPRRWITPPRWTGAITDYFDRRVDRVAGSPEQAVQMTDAWVAKAQRRYGPDSWKTVNTMEAAAKRRDAAGDHQGALALRLQVLARRREHLGPEHRQTLSAEYALAGTLLGLDEPDQARPYADHALESYTAELGPDDPVTLAALERCARIRLQLGETVEGIFQYRRAVAGFRSLGDQERAERVTINLGRLLLADGHQEEALAVFRELVDVQGLRLGPDDPATLASLRDLALTLARLGRLSEAKVVAQNLVDGTTRVHGPDHEATADARRLLDRIDASLRAD